MQDSGDTEEPGLCWAHSTLLWVVVKPSHHRIDDDERGGASSTIKRYQADHRTALNVFTRISCSMCLSARTASESKGGEPQSHGAEQQEEAQHAEHARQGQACAPQPGLSISDSIACAYEDC